MMSILRAVLGVIGLFALAAAAGMAYLGAPPAVVITFATIGALLILGALFERVTYKKLAQRKPPSDFVATPERFIDPTSGKLVQVYTKPETGERVYVDLGAQPPAKAKTT
jgi:hypothetical protein